MKALPFVFSVVLGMLASSSPVSAACTPGSCDDNNVCTTDTCDPVQGCVFTPVSCDDGNACTADSCSPVPGTVPATVFIGHDTRTLAHEYNKIGTFVQTWGALGAATGAAQDGSAVYISNPAYGNNVIERRGPGNTNLGSFTAAIGFQFIEDMGNFVPGFILASAFGGGIYSINTSNGAGTLLFSTGTNLTGVTYDGTYIWTTGGNTVYKRTLSGSVVATFTTSMANNAIGYDPDDGTLWIGHAMGQVTHHTQSGTTIGGFSTVGTNNFIDGVELIKLPIAAGCRNVPLDCNDNEACTDDACDPLSGCYHPPHRCDDSNPCTDDACVSQTGCVYTNNNGPCEDSNLCTTGDTCSNGLCQPGPATDCSDNNVCTDDACDPRTGCFHTDNTNFCNDGNACTVEDFCANGTCQPGFPLVCNDGNACTADSCVPANGCVYAPLPNGTACDDGNACTNGDLCVNGTCHGAPLICPAPDPCHLAGGCDPASGACSNPPAPNGTACNDGNPCTVNDVCTNGVCGGGLIAVPAETHGFAAGADKATYTWSPDPEATAYDAVRGGTLPVGGSSTETCFGGMTSAKLVDGASPAPGTVFWYLSRARNPCGMGPWGTQSNGTARATGACP